MIEEKLTPLIDSRYIYLDLPYHCNIGDSLIWMGTDYFLKRLTYQSLGNHSMDTFKFAPLPKDVVILLHGGGNFGDIWHQHQEFRLKVIQEYPDNRIIILPQTVYYKSETVFVEDIRKMNLHRKLIICARDSYSAELLRKNCYNGQLLTLPDMAFCIERKKLSTDTQPITKENLLLLRDDQESPLDIKVKDFYSEDMDIKDWPQQKAARRTARKYIHRHTAEDTDTFFQTKYLPQRISEGVRFVSEYKMVYSTRLHVAILRLLLGQPVMIMNNSYGKNLNFYNTWLTDSELVSTPGEEELKQLGMMVETCRQKLKTGKRRKQYRALLWFLSAILLVCTLVLLYILLSDKY